MLLRPTNMIVNIFRLASVCVHRDRCARLHLSDHRHPRLHHLHRLGHRHLPPPRHPLPPLPKLKKNLVK